VRFRYLRDPLFLCCVAIYFVNRFLFKAIWKDGFVHEHLNDLLCIPFWVPIMVFAQRKLGLRDGHDRPRASEIAIPLLLWSWLFEIVLPHTEIMGRSCTADHLDILFYSLGAVLAGVFWAWWYRDSPFLQPD
jgi:hypothetical protein